MLLNAVTHAYKSCSQETEVRENVLGQCGKFKASMTHIMPRCLKQTSAVFNC